MLECLRDNSIKIPTDSDCHEALFRVEQETDADSKLDLVLNSECSLEMKLFCNTNPDNMLNCLKLSSNKEVILYIVNRCALASSITALLLFL